MIDLNYSQTLAARPGARCFLGLLILGGLLAASAPAQTFTTLHDFSESPTNAYGYPTTNSDGFHPQGGLIVSGNTLYGTAAGGGRSGNGTVFAVNTDGTGFTNLHSFTALSGSGGTVTGTNADGATPVGRLILSGGTLYGTTANGGPSGNGTVFAVNTDGTGFTNLHAFTETSGFGGYYGTNSDGANPAGQLILSGNLLYGTTANGGGIGGGTVFSINPNGSDFTILLDFGLSDGWILSGSTVYGNFDPGFGGGSGSVFAVNIDGTGLTNLYNFSPGTMYQYPITNNDGADPTALILSGNILYGAAFAGGTAGNGTVFAVNTNGTDFIALHDFTGPPLASFNSDGMTPNGLILSGNVLYGTANQGGSAGRGTIFALNTDGTDFTNFYSFTALAPPPGPYTNSDGTNPNAGVVLANNTLYGTAYYGGSSGNGTVFSFALPVRFAANPAVGLVPLTVQFTSPTTDDGGNAFTNWNWNFGDGSTSTAQNPWHVYAAAATFSPTLMVTNNQGAGFQAIGPSIRALLTLVQNGGFETGDFTGWALSGDTSYTIVDDGSQPGITPYSGNYEAALGTTSALGYLTQRLPTLAGASYLLSFWLISPDGMTPNEFMVSWDGNTLFDQTNLAAFGWTNFQFVVTATGGSADLRFGFRDDPSYLGLDDVSVASQPSIAGLTLSGTNLVVNGNYGASGTTYRVLMSTNLALPLSQWTPVVTNVLNASGNFTITATNAVDPNAPQRFYILKMQ
ncbi:MAG TPA: choice-of-anchor tandem repeat GloVer-containing protein [Candidatus Acidoferrum sp.]|nr:choice-of-anchor tandem repeat GloVer-containing protein [Candidatus Acidoferrum sp.]